MQDIAGRQPPLCTQPEEFILSCQRKQQPPLQIHLQQSYQRVITRSQSSKAFQERQSQNAVHQLKQQQSLPQPLHSPHTSSAGGHHMHPSKSISIFAYKTLNTVFKSSRKIIVRVCDVASVKKSFTMFKFNKAAAQHRAESRANNCTGHDQFVRPPVSDKPNLKYQYSALDSGNGVAEHISREKTHRDRALIATEEWIQNSNGRYEIISHLHEIGSRHSKNWFLVNDSSVRTDRLLTLLPLPPNCAALEDLVQNECPRIVFMELLGSLHHPYIYPVLDLGFLSTSCSNYACLVTPFNSRGSLKDLIYKAQWNEPWERKYARKPHGLPASQIQRLGRQILEALLFLKERGFPLHGHLHSGNVILQNGAARLSGLENGLLGLSSRVNAVIWSRSTTEIENVDIICFGHLLYEMCTGAEMTTPKPSMRMLRMELDNYPQILDILELIFDPPTGIRPKVEELVLCDIFRSIDLRELRGSSFSTIKPSLSKSSLHLLQAVKKRQRDSLGGSLSEASSPCTPPTTPRDRRSGIMDSLEVSTDCEDDLFEEIFVGYSYQPQVSKIFRIEQNQHLQLVQNSDYHHSKLTEQKQKQRNYLSSSIMYCNNSTHICDKNSRTAEKHQNHHLHTQEQDFRCCSGDSSNLNALLAKDTAQPRRNGPSDSLASAARTVINPQENTDGIQTTESCQVVPDCIISKDCEAKSNSKQMLVETGASASHQALGNGACTTVGNCISHPRTSVAVTLHNHQLTADKCCYNNSKSRRLEYSLKCLKYGRSNPSQDSAFGSLTDGDLSTGSSSFRLSSFQSMSSPIDEGIEDAIKATTKTGHETNSEFFTIPNNMISQDSAISSPCKEFSPSNFLAIDEGVSISESSSHVHSQQFPVSLSSRTLVTAVVNSTSSLGPVNSDQQLQLFDPPKILVNDQNSIYTTSPSKRSGTIEVFSQKYRVSSFEDLSTNQSCYGSGKHLKHVKRMAFRSLEEERRIDSAFKPIQDRTSSEICINVQSDNYKKLTHASFRISETSSQSGSLDTSQGLHVSSTSKISATNILCSCDVCCRAACATKPVSGSTSNRQTIWRVNKFYRKNHIAKSNDSLRETSPNHSTRLSPTLLRNNLYETTPPYESTHNKRHQLLNRHCSANEISYSDHTLRHNLSVSINPFESRRYCSSKSEDLGDPSNFYDDCVMDSRKSYSERTLIDYANTDLKKNKHTGTNVTYIKKDVHNDEDEIKNNIRGESFMQMFQYGNIKHQQCLSTCSINCITRTKLRTTSLAAIPCHQDEAFVQNSFASCKSVKAASANSIRSSALRSPDYAPQSTDNSESSGAETAAEEYSSTEELLVSSHQLLSTAELSRIFATGSADVNSCGDEIPLLGVEMSPITPTETDGDTEFN